LNSWRGNRNKEGWKETNKRKREDEDEVEDEVNPNTVVLEDPPDWVFPVSRLKLDIEALMELTHHEDPPDVPIRSVESAAMYLVGDASGAGFGSTNWTQGDKSFGTNYGTWKRRVTEDESSNFREAGNLIIRAKALIREGKLKPGS
jgi:hypothetical protein